MTNAMNNQVKTTYQTLANTAVPITLQVLKSF